MKEITKELNSATEYLRAMKKSGHNKGDCNNILMHLANIEELVKNLTIPVVSISVDRVNNYGRQQFNRGVMDLDLVKFEDWQYCY